ncbi:unnamed protein product [Schistosoma margrebowiei]|uniref:Uncharacterized protein n=1 Tax=Schistosoma margrebowiei TaxID=48269 RepID=A0A183LSI2_9TREM|nr:unnamed protein product [Schistosoma margrebowiei]
MLENLNPVLHVPVKPRLNRLGLNINNFEWDGQRQLIDKAEIFDHIRDIRDPEHPHSLEVLSVLTDDWINVNDAESWVCVEYSPTIPGCSMATLIGLAIKVKLIRSLPRRFKVSLLLLISLFIIIFWYNIEILSTGYFNKLLTQTNKKTVTKTKKGLKNLKNCTTFQIRDMLTMKVID